jgi:ribonuclease BN (tRNA processing enzyme)
MGGYPVKGTGTSAYLYESRGQKILIDCGSNALSELSKYIRPADLDAALLSHLHSDHFSDMLNLRYLLKVEGRTLDVYLPKEQTPEYELLAACPNLALHAYSDGDTVLGGVTVRAAPAIHSREGVSISVDDGAVRLVYSGDTALNDNLSKLCEGADLLLCNCGIPAKYLTGHYLMSVEEGAALARLAGASLIVTHINARRSPKSAVAALIKKYPSDKIILAKKGLTVEI